jgi:hypothetical protein
MQSHPSPVQGGGAHWLSGWQVPVPPGITVPFWQQTKPESHASWTPPLHTQSCPVHVGLHSAFVRQMPRPPGRPVVPQQTKKSAQAP